MEIIQYNQNDKIYIPQYLKNKLNKKNFCFIDIETTGFSRTNNNIILIGLLIVQKNYVIINQFFAESIEEELDLLKSFIDFAKKIDYFISYNGNNFDIPFINNRCAKLGLEFNISSKQSIDIFKIIKKYKRFLQIDNLKLKSVEKFIGIDRTDIISGKEIVNLYNNYQKNKNFNLKKLILKHNYDDVYNLPFVLKIFDVIDNKTSFNINIMLESKHIPINVYIRDVSKNQNYIYVQCITTKLNFKKQIYFSQNYSFSWLPEDGFLNINFEIKKGKLSNKKDCYYINQTSYQFVKYVVDDTKYRLPKNILLIKYDDIIALENLKNFIKLILEQTLN